MPADPVEASPRPQEVTGFGGRERFLPKEQGTEEECTWRPRHPGPRAAASAGPGSARSLPPCPTSPGPRGTRHLPSLGYSQSPGLPVVFHHGGCDGAIPGQGGGQGWGGEGVGRKGRGAPGTGWGQRKGHRTRLLGSVPPARSGHCAPTRSSRRRRRMNKMAAATSQAGSEAERRRRPPGHRSGQPRRPAPGSAEGRDGGGPLREPGVRTTSPRRAGWPAPLSQLLRGLGAKRETPGKQRKL